MRATGRIGLMIAAIMGMDGATPTLAHLKPGDTAPAYQISTFDRQKIASDQLRGDVVIINFWATWCGPCKKELPDLEAYYRRHAAQGLRIYAVATEDSVPDYALKPLASLLSFPLAHRISGKGLTEMDAVPTNYVIDRQGVVRWAKAGAFDPETLDKVVGPLLAEAPPTPISTPTLTSTPTSTPAAIAARP